MSYSLDSAIEQFLKEKGDEAIQIQIMERKSNGRGVFFVNFKDNTNVECYYIPFHDKRFPQQYIAYYRERTSDSQLDSVLFFIFYKDEKEQLLELNIDPNAKPLDTNIEELD